MMKVKMRIGKMPKGPMPKMPKMAMGNRGGTPRATFKSKRTGIKKKY